MLKRASSGVKLERKRACYLRREEEGANLQQFIKETAIYLMKEQGVENREHYNWSNPISFGGRPPIRTHYNLRIKFKVTPVSAS